MSRWRERPVAALAARAGRIAPCHIRLRPRSGGGAMALAIGAIWLIALNYRLNLAYLLAYWLAAMALLSLAFTWRELAGLEVRLDPAEPVFAGGVARLPLTVSNPAARARLALEIGWEGGPVQHVALAAGETRRLDLSLSLPRRGRWPLPPLRLASSAPFGLARASAGWRFPLTALAWPQPDDGGPSHQSGATAGEAPPQPADDGDEWSQLAPWRPGESAARVAWKTVAHGGALLALQFEAAAGAPVARLDWFDWPELATEARLARLARLALDAQRAGCMLQLRLPEGVTAGTLGDVLTALALHPATAK